MVVDRHRKDPFGAFLADDILIEHPFDLRGLGDRFGTAALVFFGDFIEQLVGIADALLADIDALSADEAQAFALAFAAEDAVKQLLGIARRDAHFFLTMTSSMMP